MLTLPVNKPHRLFLNFGAVQCGVLGALALTNPGLWSSTAYTWILGILPLTVLGVLWLCLAVVAAFLSLSSRRTREANLKLLVAWQVLYTLVQFGFAWSIFTLTWQGFYGAIAGSLQWGGLAYVSWLWMRPADEETG